MNLCILQLSDIHISRLDNPILKRVDAIKSAVRAHKPDNCALLLAYTGDIAFSGSEQEYPIATSFLDAILGSLSSLPSLRVLGTAMIPGNHDCDFSAAGDARGAILSNAASNLTEIDLNGESIEQLLKVQNNFFEFERTYSRQDRQLPCSRLSWSHLFALNGGRVLVRCLNTALFSRLKEMPGQLHFPLHAIPDQQADADFAVTLLHHPYGWLAPDNSRELKRRVEAMSDLVLTGHEHDGDSYTRITHSGEETGYVEGAALQATGDTGFNFIVINLPGSTNQIYSFCWAEDIYHPNPSEARVFTRKQTLLESRFENDPTFARQLNNLGTGFSHPSNQELVLKDVFVYPDLKVASISSKSHPSIQSWDVLPYVNGKEYLNIAGPPTSGKSTLARALYLDLKHQFGLVPVLLDARNIKTSTKEDLRKVVDRAFREQYRATLFERFSQLDRQRKVLLIDDWHRCRIPGKSKRALVEAAREEFGKVIVFSDDVSLFQLLADLGEDVDSTEVEYCEIKQFGYRLRSEIIRKWHSIGSDSELDDLELISRISTSENLLDTLVRKGIVPSWPIFILSVLQAASFAVEETASYGSYGHLYQALLTKRMALTSKKRSSIGQKYTYLSMVAYELFSSSKTVLSESQLRSINQKYEHEYQVPIDEKELWEELQLAQVFVRSGDEFRFQHKYAYYFFLAKYFQEGIGNIQEATHLRKLLSNMVRCVHDEDNANILIFYIYLTKDRQVIDQMLEVASLIYSEKEPAHLTQDVEFVNRLRSGSPDILLKRDNVEANRAEYRSRLDESETQQEINSEPLVKTEYGNELPDSLKVEFAFKSLRVMGQVVKNFPLDLRGDLKLALTRQSYELTFRTLRTFLNIIESNMPEFLGLLKNALRGLEPFSKKKDDEILNVAQATMVRLTEFAIFGMIKRLSLAVGVVDLKETYYQVRQSAGEDDVPTRLIDLSIKLDHFAHIPEEDVRELELRLRDNITAYTILKLLVAEFLHLFPCDYKMEQKMVQLFRFRPHIGKLGSKIVKKSSD